MKHLSVFLGFSCLFTLAALAGDDEKNLVAPAPEPAAFARGTWELEGGSGFFGSFSTTSARRTTINYQLNDLALGWMYDAPRHNGWLRGNNEFLVEIFGAPITKGPGTYIAGGSLLWRYNFVQPSAKLIPYFQIGAGALDNDIYRNHDQEEVGEAFEFLLGADFGLKYMINDHWAASIEAGYRHISNADLAPRNEGLNSIGGMGQLSYFFY